MRKCFMGIMLTVSLVGCSNDDDKPKCEACTSTLGNTFKLCDNGDGSYEYEEAGNTITLGKEALGNLSLKQAVQGFCDADLPQ